MPHSVQPLPVPVSGYHRYRWAVPQRLHGGLRWYYGLQLSQSHPGSLRVDPRSLDRPLRALVPRLHRAGIPTTPSCAGHWSASSRRDAAAVYRQLQQDAQWIRSYGLTLRCLESGQSYVYRDPDYCLPGYSTFAATYDPPGVGGIGLVFRTGDARLPRFAGVLRAIPGVSVSVYREKTRNLLLIQTSARNPQERNRIWSQISRALG